MNIFRYFDLARNMSEKFSFECVKFYTSLFFLRQVATGHFVDLTPLGILFNLFKKIIFEKTFSFLKIITFDMYSFFVKIL